MPWAVAAWSPLYLRAKSELARDVAGAKQLLRLRRQEGEMMHTRPVAMKKDEVMRIPLPLQENAAKAFIIRRDIFRQPEPQAHVEFQRPPYVRGQHLDVIEPQRAAAFVPMKVGDVTRLDWHARTELQKSPAWIRDMQGPVLIGDRRPSAVATKSQKEIVRLVEILIGQHAQADPQTAWR